MANFTGEEAGEGGEAEEGEEGLDKFGYMVEGVLMVSKALVLDFLKNFFWVGKKKPPSQILSSRKSRT